MPCDRRNNNSPATGFFRDTNSLHLDASTTGRGKDCKSLDSDVLANKESASTRSAISVPQGCGLIRTEFSVGTATGIVRTDFRPVLYICALHAHAGIALSGVFLLYRVDNRIHTYSTKNRPFWTLAEVLANYT